MQNTGIKKDGKINVQDHLKQTQYNLYVYFTQPAWALAGSPKLRYS